jgi:hypothetical protein
MITVRRGGAGARATAADQPADCGLLPLIAGLGRGPANDAVPSLMDVQIGLRDLPAAGRPPSLVGPPQRAPCRLLCAHIH